MSDTPLLIDRDGDVLYLTLNRPGRLNALSNDMLDELTHTFTTVSRDATAIVVGGSGRAFCSGHDLKEAASLGRLDTTSARSLVERMQAVATAMRDCPVPIVTRVHGYAIGGGAEIALSGDVVIAEADAVFRFTEASVGRVVTNGVTNLMPKTVGPVRAKALFMLGRPLTGAQAHDWGLVSDTVQTGELDGAVGATLDVLRSQSTWAVSAAKRLINQGVQTSFEAAIDFEVGAAIEAELGPDAEAAATSFADSEN